MKILYNAVVEENDKLKKQKQELLEFIDSVQVALSHLLQDGNITESGLTSAENLLQYTDELQEKYRSKNEKY
jgi:hypothetical protein